MIYTVKASFVYFLRQNILPANYDKYLIGFIMLQSDSGAAVRQLTGEYMVYCLQI